MLSTIRLIFVRLLIIAVFIIESIPDSNCRVLELSDRFLDVNKQGLWLVKFYAPWCGHCKRLEPIWNQIAQSLHYTSVRVGRVDCTRFTAVATEYNIRGFPTILFINKDTIYTYKGDRNREEIVEFALRLEGPALRTIKDRQEYDQLVYKYDVFFLILVDDNRNGSEVDVGDSELEMVFGQVAKTFHAYLYFYQATSDAVPEELLVPDSNHHRSVFVIKDGTHSSFEPSLDVIDTGSDQLNVSLASWVTRERFPFFVKVTQGSLPQLLKTEKLLVISVLDEDLVGKFSSEMEAFRSLLKTVALEHKDELKKSFLFGWTPQANLANSLAMQRLQVPCLIVVNSVTYEYYIPDDETSQLTSEAILSFLGQILENSVKVHGGNGIFTKIYRVYYDVSTSLTDMWTGNPVLTTVLFGLPFGFLLLIFYSICCADIMDAADEEEDDENIDGGRTMHEHAKRE